MISSLFWSILLLCMVGRNMVATLPVGARQQTVQSIEDDWPLTSEFAVRDNIQTYYENIVDDVLSTQSEDLLLGLSRSLRDRQQLTKLLGPQAARLGFVSMHETCMMKMPGFIASRLNELNNRIFTSVDPAVSEWLPVRWPEGDHPEVVLGTLRERDEWSEQNELVSSLQSLKQDIQQSLWQVMDQYALHQQIAKDIQTCQQEREASTSDSHASHRLSWFTNLGQWFGNRDTTPKEERDLSDVSSSEASDMLQVYIDAIRIELASEFDDRIDTLVSNIYTDLLFEDTI
ncbi:uncharacterized protein BYT42DRAFT_603796 [Radiomyces spectabilis]|uniref:uncharacterized protein n=1 Tax=Radiomyces spectabilis TaxID=64574 RepID=UPI00221EDCD9|nr:uncharacterized protein BYT42DRAFT_603796 [Radiomyces spectabilis]KAI8384831.1 hypothetical protein BYT42DRAFT_603796 [Radiomyces spectabilis]